MCCDCRNKYGDNSLNKVEVDYRLDTGTEYRNCIRCLSVVCKRLLIMFESQVYSSHAFVGIRYELCNTISLILFTRWLVCDKVQGMALVSPL
jgi:hypothetical protein